MVADIAIHRDDDKNPHAHVMLTMCPFLEDGSWGAKLKKEYILDEDGESLYTASGAKKSRKIDMNDWNKREKIQEWRQAWALYANQHLALAGVAVEITEKSHAALGLEQEGRSSDRVEINRQVKARNDKVVSLLEVDEKLTNLENHQLILQALFPAEKKELGQLSKVLKMYVKPESLADKRRMLYLWDVKLQAQVDLGLFNESSYKGYQAQEEAFQLAEELFNREADRLTVKYYPTLDTSQWTSYEKRELVNETARLGRTLNELEIKETLLQAREEEVVEQVQSILKQPIPTVIEAQERIQAVQTRAATFSNSKGYRFSRKHLWTVYFLLKKTTMKVC
ncbi:MobA/MobL family protein [Virgibacillus sp. Bac330]|uniref:MobA/MobL family protein n=1 Tax=Virgibacillus sp. Bac330 TaxID=2419841 RepID=UPI000EF4D67A|nr:MobA/MobL family protein [Virgibacillus sp. Bac330]